MRSERARLASAPATSPCRLTGRGHARTAPGEGHDLGTPSVTAEARVGLARGMSPSGLRNTTGHDQDRAAYRARLAAGCINPRPNYHSATGAVR
ncbi:hypothetical protein SAMN05444415_110160 [Salipiger profundus]|jgi:hypothetical protein|nr:hypothetical protein SAMN05444415_110160 [Salipiger profundus]